MTQHLMLRLLEEQRQNLDKNVVGGVLMDLSKVLDCVPRDLLFEILQHIVEMKVLFIAFA